MNSLDFLKKTIADLKFKRGAVSCTKDTSVSKVLEILRTSKIGSIVVLQGRKPLGIFTERDFLMKFFDRKLDLDKEQIGDYMTPSVVTMNAHETLLKVVQRMRTGNFRHMVIVNDDGDLEHVISIKDVMDCLVVLQYDKP